MWIYTIGFYDFKGERLFLKVGKTAAGNLQARLLQYTFPLPRKLIMKLHLRSAKSLAKKEGEAIGCLWEYVLESRTCIKWVGQTREWFRWEDEAVDKLKERFPTARFL